MTALHESYVKGELPEKFVNHAFRGFANSSADLETNLDDWIRKFPDSYAAHTARGMYFQNLGWLARQGRLARKTDPEQFQRMSIYFDKARANFKAALAIKPNLGLAYSRLYVMAVANSSRKDHKEILRLGFDATPDSHALLLAWMWSLRPEWGGSLADMVRFGRYLDKKRATNPKIPWLKSHIYLVRAKRYSRASDYDEAIRVLTEGLEQKEMSDLYIARGDNYQSLGEHEKAVKDFTRALELWPQNASALIERAWSYRRLDLLHRALADLNLAIRLDPRDPHARRNRAFIYRKQKKNKKALRDINAALEFGKFSAGNWFERGNLYLDNFKSPKKAAADFKQATELDPEDPDYWNQYSVALYRLRDCKITETLQRYLALCRAGKKCSRSTLEAAVGSLESFVKNPECPKIQPHSAP